MVHYLLIIISHFVNQNNRVQIDYLITLIGLNQFVQIDKVVFYACHFGFFRNKGGNIIVTHSKGYECCGVKWQQLEPQK